MTCLQPIEVYEQAQAVAKERRPQASEYKVAAFARSVTTLVTGWVATTGGPSVRDHSASVLYGDQGGYTFDEAVEILIREDGLIFGPITDLHRQCWQEKYCFDDDPDDVRELSGL